MLVMRRKEGEAIRIGADVEIRILSIRGSKVKIGITAPRSVEVSAYEIELVRNENLAASQAIRSAPDIVAHLMQAFAAQEIIKDCVKIPERIAETSDVRKEQ